MVPQAWSQTVGEDKITWDQDDKLTKDLELLWEKTRHDESKIVWADDPFESDERPSKPNHKSDPFLERKILRKNGNPFIRDPFVSTKLGVKTDNVTTLIEHILVPNKKLNKWENDHPNEVITRQEIDKWLSKGDAQLTHSSLQVCRSGHRATGYSGRELIYPTEYVPMGEGAWPMASCFETRNVGHIYELNSSLNHEGVIEMGWVMERSAFIGSISYDALIDKTKEPEDVFVPVIDSALLHTKFMSSPNESHYLGQLRGGLSVITKKNTTRLVFIKADVTNSIPSKEAIVAEATPILFDFKLVEVDHQKWSENFSGKPLGEVRNLSSEWTQKYLDEGTASSVNYPKILASPREKVTLEVVREFIYPTSYKQREVDGKLISAETIETSLVPTDFETRNTGFIMELQAVRLASGNVFVRYNWELVRQSGYSIHHRVKDQGKWVPDIMMPKFITTRQDTSLDLMPGNDYSLVGIFAANTDDGKSDESTRILAFLRVK